MIILIKEKWGKWNAGDLVDVTPDFAKTLIDCGAAEIHDSQARIDKPETEKKEETNQTITVNNYYVIEEETAAAPTNKSRKK